MPYEITWNPPGVVKRFFGFATGDEFIQSVHEIASHSLFDRIDWIINDFLDIDDHSIDQSVLDPLAYVRFGAMLTNPSLRVLIVAEDSRLLDLVNRMHAPPYSGAHETRFFGTMAQAKEWLDTNATRSRQRGFHFLR